MVLQATLNFRAPRLEVVAAQLASVKVLAEAAKEAMVDLRDIYQTKDITTINLQTVPAAAELDITQEEVAELTVLMHLNCMCLAPVQAEIYKLIVLVLQEALVAAADLQGYHLVKVLLRAVEAAAELVALWLYKQFIMAAFRMDMDYLQKTAAKMAAKEHLG